MPLGVDIGCLECGYNLRGQDRAGRCPECGCEVLRSTDAVFGKRKLAGGFQNAAWFGLLAAGALPMWQMLMIGLGLIATTYHSIPLALLDRVASASFWCGPLAAGLLMLAAHRSFRRAGPPAELKAYRPLLRRSFVATVVLVFLAGAMAALSAVASFDSLDDGPHPWRPWAILAAYFWFPIVTAVLFCPFARRVAETTLMRSRAGWFGRAARLMLIGAGLFTVVLFLPPAVAERIPLPCLTGPVLVFGTAGCALFGMLGFVFSSFRLSRVLAAIPPAAMQGRA